MTAPRPNPTPPTRLPPVRLEVRTGSGQIHVHDLDSEEFLIGGAPGCDLRLPAPNLPPVVCQISRRPDGIRIRRLAPGIQVLLNGALLPGNIPTVVADGDRLAVAGVEIAIAVSSSGFLSPGFVPLDPYSSEIEAPGPDVERLRQWEESLAVREAEIAHREQMLREERDLFDRDRLKMSEDILRVDRRRAETDEAERRLEARAREYDLRFEQLTRDVGEWEEMLRLASTEQDRIRADAERLDRQKIELDAQSAKLAERAAQLAAQQGLLAVLRAKLDRTREEMEREAVALATARVREEEAQAELLARLRETEQIRAELSLTQRDADQERRQLVEHDSLLNAGLAELRQQKEQLEAEAVRLREREAELDVRAADLAEQVGTLTGRMAQALDLQARLEADRVALREREGGLTTAEDARLALQEQLRRRAESLAARSRELDELAVKLSADRGAIEQSRAEIEVTREAAAREAAAIREAAEARAAEIDRQSNQLAERESALARQLVRLKEIGQAVAAERKALSEVRAGLDRTREEAETFRARAEAEVAALRAQAPELEGHARAALERLLTALETLRGHLAELHDYVRRSREDLDGVREQLRGEAERLAGREAALEKSRAEHRLAVTDFRQQMLDWQGKIAEMKQALSRGESQLESRQAEVDRAARQVDATTRQLAEQSEQLRREREEVVQRRTEIEQHLADMREWYRKKLRELAQSRGARNADTDAVFTGPRLAAIEDGEALPLAAEIAEVAVEELDPGDRQLGELLQSLELVDADTLASLWQEAGRQRRTLRQVLLASGAVTLYQLALIEAGNLDGLMLGRLRVIDRLRVTPREAVYRVLDPTRLQDKSHGVFMLRYLSEAESHDAVRPDDFRQRFSTARDAAHPNLAAVVEVLDIGGRPAALLEWPSGLFGGDWPPETAHPGCWVRLATMAAEGIDAAHRAGLVHGRITADSFILDAEGVLKVTGFEEPTWLRLGPEPGVEPAAAADLRNFGQVLFGWSQLMPRKKGSRTKPFPAELAAIIRRLEADVETPMADTVASDRPYESASELVADLKQVARETSFSDDAWKKLLRHVADNASDAPAALRQSA